MIVDARDFRPRSVCIACLLVSHPDQLQDPGDVRCCSIAECSSSRLNRQAEAQVVQCTESRLCLQGYSMSAPEDDRNLLADGQMRSWSLLRVLQYVVLRVLPALRDCHVNATV